MLIASPRHTREDLRVWAERERMDAQYVARAGRTLDDLEARAMDAIDRFVDAGGCYVGVSWGKDSVVVAHLALRTRPTVPLVWVRVEPIANPDCDLVRDAFLARTWDPAPTYHEYVEHCTRDERGLHASGTLERGFARAPSRRYISGVRAEESGVRKLSALTHGVATERTCRPILHWRAEHVFGYLHRHGLPVHPAYACSLGGTIDRGRLRVSSLEGSRGTGHGRAEWERRYYGVLPSPWA